MLPLLQKEIVEKRQYATEEEVLEYYAVGQCTPGIIAVNTATFIGYKRKGIAGAVAASLGLITPSICIILVISYFLRAFIGNPMVEHAFAGIRVVVVALIVDAVIKFLKSGIKSAAGAVIFVASFALSAFFDISPVIVVCAAIVYGLCVTLFVRQDDAGGKEDAA